MDAIVIQPPAIGHNSGTADLAILLDAAVLAEGLSRDFAHKISRKDKLLAGHARLIEAFPNGIQTDGDHGRAADFARQIREEVGQIEEARKATKQPILDAGRAIDGFFNGELSGPLAQASADIMARLTDYLQRKERAARAAAAAEAQRKADEAARLAAQAAQPEGDLEAAIQAEQDALDAQDAVATAPRAAARVISDLGTSSSLRRTRVPKVLDMMALIRAVAAGKAPANLLTLNEPVAKAMARDKNQSDLPGLAFVDASKASIR